MTLIGRWLWIDAGSLFIVSRKVISRVKTLGVPAVELRAISNAVADRDRSKWTIDDALAALGDGLRAVLEELERA